MKTIYVDSKTGNLGESFSPPSGKSTIILAKDATEVLDALTHPEGKVPVVPAGFGLWEIYNALEAGRSAASRTRR